MSDDWEMLATGFVTGAYATVKGKVRTRVVHEHLLHHLPAPPARLLDVGGGAGHQSLPLARLGYQVTVLDASGRLFEGTLRHGVLMYLVDPAPLLRSLSTCTAPGGVVSVLALNARTMAVRPALERRFADARAAFDATTEQGVLGVPTRSDTVAALSSHLEAMGVTTEAWYGVWLFSDWLELAGVPASGDDLRDVAALELEASRREPYRQMSRLFHLVGRKTANPSPQWAEARRPS